MESLADDSASEPTATQDKPCRICRRRKVRCSKTEPCTNCQRGGLVCEYDVRRGGSSTLSTADLSTGWPSDLGTIARGFQSPADFVEVGTSREKTKPGLEVSRGCFAVERIMDEFHLKSSAQTAQIPLARPIGKLVLDGSSSRHVLSSFWATMYEEVDDLKFLLREEKEMLSQASWLRSRQEFSLQPIALILPPAHSEYLVRAYISSVDQSVRVLHKPTLLKKVKLFWRAVLTDYQDLECQLVVIYCLALLSVSPQDCELYLGQSHEVLAKRLHAQAEKSVATLSVVTTHNLASLQTFVLYMTYLCMTGKTLLASSLLGMAIRTAQRMGIHRDGTHYSLSPWQIEIRRRLWHHILLIDTWCIEHHGLESAVSSGYWDTKLPLNANDATWDVSDNSNRQPIPQSGFTDNTFALVQYEAAAFIRVGLDSSLSIDSTERGLSSSRMQLQRSFWDDMEARYLSQLDASQPQQDLVLRSTHLVRDRMRLAFARLACMNGDTYQDQYLEDESQLLASAVDYCKSVQAARVALIPARLDWVIVRAFCWNSLMIMLSTTLRRHGLTRSENAKWALQRLIELLDDQPTIDYLKGNETLWPPVGKLFRELISRHGEVSRPLDDLEQI